jgi:hypothetical protein
MKNKFLTQSQAAVAAGTDQPQLSKWERAGFLKKPAGHQYTQGDVEKIKLVAAERRACTNRTAAMSDAAAETEGTLEHALGQLRLNPEKAARVRYLIEKTASVKQRRELEAGGWLRKEDVDSANVRKIYVVRAKMQELPIRAHLLVGKTEVEIERELTAWMKEVCDYFANGGQGGDETGNLVPA